MDLIDRQAAIDAIEITPFDDYGDYMRARELIEQLPSAQPTIVRCRDCKYSIDEYNDGDCYCKRPSRELVWIGKSWDFFCKAGAKREGEEHE